MHPSRIKKREKKGRLKKIKVPEEKTITARNSAEDTWRLSVTRVVMAACQGRPSDGQRGWFGGGGVREGSVGIDLAAVDGRGRMGVGFKQSGEVSGK